MIVISGQVYWVKIDHQVEVERRENFEQDNVACLLYSVLTSNGSYQKLSIGFARERLFHQKYYIANKRNIGRFHVRIVTKGVFGWTAHQKKLLMHKLNN